MTTCDSGLNSLPGSAYELFVWTSGIACNRWLQAAATRSFSPVGWKLVSAAFDLTHSNTSCWQ